MSSQRLPLLISPSLLSADQLNIEKDIKDAESCGADCHHVDVMDGHYVPNLTFGLPLIKALKQKAKIPLNVHLMITNPDHTALDYVTAGADYLSFHVEIARHAHRLLQAIRAAGAKPGVAINPGTPIETLWPLLPHCDFINVMSVNPGFSGQSFIPQSLQKIKQIHERLCKDSLQEKVRIEVDGGVNADTATSIIAAGASMLVTGQYFFGATDRRTAMFKLRNG